MNNTTLVFLTLSLSAIAACDDLNPPTDHTGCPSFEDEVRFDDDIEGFVAADEAAALGGAWSARNLEQGIPVELDVAITSVDGTGTASAYSCRDGYDELSFPVNVHLSADDGTLALTIPAILSTAVGGGPERLDATDLEPDDLTGVFPAAPDLSPTYTFDGLEFRLDDAQGELVWRYDTCGTSHMPCADEHFVTMLELGPR